MVPRHGPRNSNLHRAKAQSAEDAGENKRMGTLGLGSSSFCPLKRHLKWLEHIHCEKISLCLQAVTTKKSLPVHGGAKDNQTLFSLRVLLYRALFDILQLVLVLISSLETLYMLVFLGNLFSALNKSLFNCSR